MWQWEGRNGWCLSLFKGKVITLENKMGCKEQTDDDMDSAKSWFYELQLREESIRKGVSPEARKEYP